MSRLPRFIRLLHSGGRQIPNPNQGGAGTAASISPSTANLPPPPPSVSPADLNPEPIDPALGNSVIATTSTIPTTSSRPRLEFRPNGKLILRRPRRIIPVTLPSGHPEPPKYPPPPEYYASIRNLVKVNPHPLWQFFHCTPAVKSLIPEDSEGPPSNGYGSLDAVDADVDALIRSGRFSPRKGYSSDNLMGRNDRTSMESR